MKFYKDARAVDAAVKRAGFEYLAYTVARNSTTLKYYAKFYLHLQEDVHYLKSKGFDAVVDTERAVE